MRQVRGEYSPVASGTPARTIRTTFRDTFHLVRDVRVILDADLACLRAMLAKSAAPLSLYAGPNPDVTNRDFRERGRAASRRSSAVLSQGAG